MESESMDSENPVAYWRIRSREGLESQGVVLPPRPLPRRIVLPRRISNSPRRVEHVRRRIERIRSREALESQGVVLPQPPPPPPLRRRIVLPRRFSTLPPRVVHVRRRIERVGVDLVCHSCRQHISKSERLPILIDFYAPDGRPGFPLTRCYLRCTSCPNGIVLGRNIGDGGTFFVVKGGARHSPASENVPDPNSDPEAEAYPDDVLDSPNDFSGRLEHWCGATTI